MPDIRFRHAAIPYILPHTPLALGCDSLRHRTARPPFCGYARAGAGAVPRAFACDFRPVPNSNGSFWRNGKCGGRRRGRWLGARGGRGSIIPTTACAALRPFLEIQVGPGAGDATSLHSPHSRNAIKDLRGRGLLAGGSSPWARRSTEDLFEQAGFTLEDAPVGEGGNQHYACLLRATAASRASR